MRSSAPLCVTIFLAALSVGCALASERRPWNVLRFLQQSSKFVSIPFIGGSSKETVIRPGDILWRQGAENTFNMAPLGTYALDRLSEAMFVHTTSKSSCGRLITSTDTYYRRCCHGRCIFFDVHRHHGHLGRDCHRREQRRLHWSSKLTEPALEHEKLQRLGMEG